MTEKKTLSGETHKNANSRPAGKAGGSNGDPVQRAAREARIKQNLRDNLRRRKQKARALTQKDESS